MVDMQDYFGFQLHFSIIFCIHRYWKTSSIFDATFGEHVNESTMSKQFLTGGIKIGQGSIHVADEKIFERIEKNTRDFNFVSGFLVRNFLTFHIFFVIN